MDSSSIKPVVEAGQPSRLPAGSTLQLANGIQVAHPHAEVNLAGLGDPRLGDSKAVTESVKYEVVRQDKPADDGKVDVVTVTVESNPLSDDVRPKVLSAVPETKVVRDATPASQGPDVAAPAKVSQVVQPAENA